MHLRHLCDKCVYKLIEDTYVISVLISSHKVLIKNIFTITHVPFYNSKRIDT